jgi:hypothetical protein
MTNTDLSFHEDELDLLKDLLKVIISSFEQGACFFVVDLDKITYKLSHKFDIAGLDVGAEYSKNGVAAKVVATGTTATMRLEKHESGIALSACGGPIWDSTDTKVIGAWVLAQPWLQKAT